MFDINKFSNQYSVRFLKENDIDLVIGVCNGNPLFYEYTIARPTKENLLEDMRLTPPGIDLKDKYYVGYFDNETLVAVLDLIDGWPSKEVAYIGFFMMNHSYQGKNIGSSIIKELSIYLKSLNVKYLRLAVNDGNPQSLHFWHKNGFELVKSVTTDEGIKHVLEKRL
jgi:RimJ/RimL family protein N-acetyltransferase